MTLPETNPQPEAPGGAEDLASARDVLRLEAMALQELAGSLGTPFIEALDVLARTRGRVIVTGMGKSGHVARKIAATLASTGTPAYFVHPGEASHGDLGMITHDDSVIALSNSGETAELADLIEYVKRFDIPLVAMTRNADGTLAGAASVSLVLPPSAEACPMGLAPTTSTTVMLALGDAIAVALLERKGFSSEQFQIFHPGGKLGHHLLRVVDIMHRGDELPLVAEDASMKDAILEMTTKRLGCVGIIDTERHLVGVITDGDLRRHMDADIMSRHAVDVMTRRPRTIQADMLASEAVRIMNEMTVTNFFVLDGPEPVGLLHIHDCLRAGVV